MLMILYNLYAFLLYSMPTVPTNARRRPALISFFASAVIPSSLTAVTTQARL